MKKHISIRIVNLSVGMVLACCLWVAVGAAKVNETPPHLDKPHAANPDVAPVKADAALQSQVSNILGKSPLAFEANAGQADPQVKYYARMPGGIVYLTPEAAVFSLSKGKLGEKQVCDVIAMELVGCNAATQLTGENELPAKSNYLIGGDPKQWRIGVAQYAKVHQHDVYPGIDLVYYGNQRQLEYDFVVAPGMDPKTIAFQIKGAKNVEIAKEGDLVMTTALGELRQNKPQAYQEVHGQRQPVEANYAMLENGVVGFQIGKYDAAQPLVIDPVYNLVYSTYLGGSELDMGYGIATDAQGNAYITGETMSPVFTGISMLSMQQKMGGGPNDTDAFLVKIDPNGNQILYATYIGGDRADAGRTINVDSLGNIYLAGYTSSDSFPGINNMSLFSTKHSNNDIFAIKLNAQGNQILFATYLGGNDTDHVCDAAITGAGKLYLAGSTPSTDFPVTQQAIQPALIRNRPGDVVGFITIFDTVRNTLEYSSYLGGDDKTGMEGIEVDALGNMYLAGWTTANNFLGTALSAIRPQNKCIQDVKNGPVDACVVKLDPTGTRVIYSTYLGGGGADNAYDIAIDAQGNAYVTGYTGSTDFPGTPLSPIKSLSQNNIQPASSRLKEDAFVAKIDANGGALIYTTYLGGSSFNRGDYICVDASGRAYVVGYTWSSDFPGTPNSMIQPILNEHLLPTLPNGEGIFLTTITGAGDAILYSTYLGGAGGDAGAGVALDSQGNLFVSGSTYSPDFTGTAASKIRNLCEYYDAFILKIGAIPLCLFTFQPNALNNGEFRLPYTAQVVVKGGVPPYAIKQTAGTMPPGLSIALNGLISGAPLVKTGTFDFTVTATDFNGCTGSKSYSITITSPKFIFTPTSLPNGYYSLTRLLAPYKQLITVTGGVAPYTFTSNVKLPPGLSLDRVTGIISGSPGTSGTYKFVITATDKYGRTGSWDYAITISRI